ncbi:hypothetical protein Pmar_PMAR026196 [Perkinsus marinus ATCC 50983]|uniref:Uncharacterized protein n=1 Tax=Perkinsus marinus (strain ATCC 50983 / TXsc) TaxID=423536 RepID=C5LRC4_PERM5|nr:hypothetical protein Pmar_PMAR026196 [Perkinsus marinus ATCC 50983]EER00719.1 hypothetical protein Pmar_PMAR026196 [Perkinsus marinus ATCC 50983]|eukprot:XP_002768001.1 hypothetical protein Pmar_PMAR026196 [Perkinsus marinus ATCC 50983]
MVWSQLQIWRYLKDNRCIKRDLAKEARTHPAHSPQVMGAYNPQVGVPLSVQINVQK